MADYLGESGRKYNRFVSVRGVLRELLRIFSVKDRWLPYSPDEGVYSKLINGDSCEYSHSNIASITLSGLLNRMQYAGCINGVLRQEVKDAIMQAGFELGMVRNSVEWPFLEQVIGMLGYHEGLIPLLIAAHSAQRNQSEEISDSFI